MNVTKLNTAVVFPCGICNLNCRYCSIDKNPALRDVDNVLAESFKGDYYYNKILKYFPNPTQLLQFETWGGEPTIEIERVFPLLRKLINHYPRLGSFFTSTNFSYVGWPQKIESLINVFGEYPIRNFTVHIQLSCDGPQYINDDNRGKGVTAKCLENYNELLQWLKTDLPQNVSVVFGPKQTLDIETIKKLQTYESVYEYYKFFEDNFLEPAQNIQRVECFGSIPNTAVPSPITKENGLEFANLCSICKQIQEENREQHFFPHLDRLIPFTYNHKCPLNFTMSIPPSGCGTGTVNISFLPNDLLCVCHLGFMEIVEKYKKYNAESKKLEKVISFDDFVAETKFKQCLTEKEFDTFSDNMFLSTDRDSTSRMHCIADHIHSLAQVGQLDEKYNELKESQEAARLIASTTSYCINDGINITGSVTLQPNGMYKQLLNGAMDIIEKELEVK